MRCLAPIVCLPLMVGASPAWAEDGPTLYKQLCASCHDTGLGRAPTRDVFVTGKRFAETFGTRPSPQAMCRAASGEFSNPLNGPAWNGWGVNTRNTRFQDAAAAGLTATDVPTLKVTWAFGFPGELSADAQPATAGGRVFGGSLNVAGPAVAGGTLIVNSGYVQNGMPGNVLLAFTVEGK